MPNLSKAFEAFKANFNLKYGENPAKMLIYTGVLGWFLSSAAQVVATMANKEIPKEAKLYIIPQEIGDGAINVLSFFAITSVIKALGSKLVSTGKLTTPAIKAFLKKTGFNTKKNIGDIGFDIGKIFAGKNLTKYAKECGEYKEFKAGVEVAAMTVGSILSCNIVTPLLRNRVAADRQLKALAKMDYNNSNNVHRPKGITMDDYRNMAYTKFSGNSGALKI